MGFPGNSVFLNIPSVCLLLYSLLSLGAALYEDQIGAFDWSQKYIGHVKFVADSPDNPKTSLFLGSSKNTIAAVHVKNGSIAWRQVQDEYSHLTNLMFCGKNLISTATDENSVLRSWDPSSGSLFWEHPFESPFQKPALWCNAENDIIVTTDGHTMESRKSSSGKSLSSVKLNDKAVYRDAFIIGTRNESTNLLVILSLSRPDSLSHPPSMTASIVSVSTSRPPHLSVLYSNTFHPSWLTQNFKSCQCTVLTRSSNLNLVCLSHNPFDNKGVLNLRRLDPALSDEDWVTVELDQVSPTLSRLTDASFVVTSLDGSGAVFELEASGLLQKLYNLEKAMFVHKVSFNGRDYLFTAFHSTEKSVKNFDLSIYDAKTGKLCSELPERQWTISKNHGAVESIYAMMFTDASGSTSFRLFVQTEDHAIQLIRQTGQQQWLRDESLADIVAVEVVDLSVSESQAKMEEEFGHSNSNVFQMFLKRIQTQMAQLLTFLQDIALDFPNSLFTFMRPSSSPENILSSHRPIMNEESSLPVATIPPRLPFSSVNETSSDSSTSSHSSGVNAFLTRDTFNLHKMIVVATVVGKLFGLESHKGRVVWEHFVPGTAPLANGKLSLFQQRNTAHFPLPPITTLLARSKKTNLPILYSFNPSTGIPLEKPSHGLFELDSDILQAVMHPGPVSEQTDFMRPVLLLDKNLQVHVYPSRHATVISDDPTPLYLYTLEPEHARLIGYRVNPDSIQKLDREQATFTATPAWKMVLRFTRMFDADSNETLEPAQIIAVASRPTYEHIHSVGRVLGDRSVLYKYLNPNLIAVVTAGGSVSSQTNTINIYLIDVVVGRIVFSAAHRRCSEPVTLVHSENWIVYTYYNHKSLRQEATVLELYEPTNYSPDGDRLCASYSVPGPAQLFLRNLIPTSWLSMFSSTAASSHHSKSDGEFSGKPNDRSSEDSHLPHLVDSGRSIFSSLFRSTEMDGICTSTGANPLVPLVLHQSYIFSTPLTPGVAAVSLTERGITSKSIIFGLQKGSLIELPKTFFDPRRALDLSQELIEEGVHPYAPVLPLSDQAVISYNQTVLGLRGIRTAATGLESTSLVFAYGLDLFFTRVAPSLTYDLLKEDFDYTAIATVTLGMIIASVATQRLAARRAVFRAWA